MPTTKNPKNPAAVALGRLGGRATSPKKAAAARANGRRRARPPRVVPKRDRP